MTPLITGLYVSQQGSHGDALDLWVSVQFRIFQFLKDLGIPLSSMHSYLNKCHSPLWRSWELTTEYTYCCASWYSSKEIGPLVNRFWVWEQAPVWKLTSFYGSGCSQLPDYLDYWAQTLTWCLSILPLGTSPLFSESQASRGCSNLASCCNHHAHLLLRVKCRFLASII